jgi:hypothetical protein
VSLYGERCAQKAERLQLMVPEELSVLGDGAEWVWSVDVVTKAFRRVVDQVGEAPLGALGWEENRAA